VLRLRSQCRGRRFESVHLHQPGRCANRIVLLVAPTDGNTEHRMDGLPAVYPDLVNQDLEQWCESGSSIGIAYAIDPVTGLANSETDPGNGWPANTISYGYDSGYQLTSSSSTANPGNPGNTGYDSAADPTSVVNPTGGAAQSQTFSTGGELTEESSTTGTDTSSTTSTGPTRAAARYHRSSGNSGGSLHSGAPANRSGCHQRRARGQTQETTTTRRTGHLMGIDHFVP